MGDLSSMARRLPWVAVCVSSVIYVWLQLRAWQIAGGIEYPLDDPYIHLAIAEQIWAGGYGVNPAELAAAASSPLYPLLLLPFTGTELHRFMPLAWNLVGMLASALIWGRILVQSGYGGRVIGLILAALGPLALHLVGVAFTGMEHSLHVAASLAIVLGLIQFEDDTRISRALILGVLFAPLIRFEGLALALCAATWVLWRGQGHLTILSRGGVLAAAALPVLGFAAILTAMGLDPVPSSVSLKMTLEEDTQGLVGYLLGKIRFAAQEPGSWVFGGYLLAAVLVFALSSQRRAVLFVVAAAAVAHGILGRFGWMDRYEIYAIAALAGALVAGTARGRVLPVLALAPMIVSAYFYGGHVQKFYPYASRPIALQQAQMGRFAKDHLAEPVAINDLGYVAWQNPHYVLDLWGLANVEAQKLRFQGGDPAWVDRLAAQHGVALAMVYDDWFPNGEFDEWQHLGRLSMIGFIGYIAGFEVSFYLKPGVDPAPYRAKIADWAVGLPQGSRFIATE